MGSKIHMSMKLYEPVFCFLNLRMDDIVAKNHAECIIITHNSVQRNWIVDL